MVILLHNKGDASNEVPMTIFKNLLKAAELSFANRDWCGFFSRRAPRFPIGTSACFVA